MLKNKYKLIHLATITALLYSSTVIASDIIPLHDKATAETQYQQFKAGNAEDPIELIRRGYAKSYADSLNGILADQKYLANQEIINAENARLNTVISGIDADKLQKKSQMYRNALNSNGEFNAEAYAESYNQYMSAQRQQSVESISSRDEFTQGLFDSTSSITGQAGNTISMQASLANANVISFINSEKTQYANSVKDSLESAVSEARSRIEQSTNTVVLANQWDGECGDACSFPPPPPPPPPPEPPVDETTTCKYDSNNYIEFKGFDQNDYDNESETEASEEWMYNGVVIYYMHETTSTRNSGSNQYIVTGSKSGYEIGNQEYYDGSANSESSDYHIKNAICKLPD